MTENTADSEQTWMGDRVITVGTDSDGHELRVREGGEAYSEYVFVEEYDDTEGVERSVLVHHTEVEDLHEAIQELMQDD